MFLRNNWKSVISTISAAFIATMVCNQFHEWELKKLKKAHESEMETQLLEYQAHELKNQNITTEASNVFQTGLGNLERDYARLMQYNTCVRFSNTSSATSRPDGANRQPKPRYRDGVDTNHLFAFSRKCEMDRLKVIGLQKFIADERK